MSSLSNKIQEVFNEPGCGKNQDKSEKERKKGCTKQLAAGRRGRRLRLRRRQDRAAADHRRRPSGAWPDRLRGQFLGQSRRQILRLQALAHRLHHRHQRNRRRVRRREAALQGDQGNHREIRSAGGLRLPDLRSRDDRRRHQRGVQGGAPRNSASRCIPVNSPGFVGPKNLGNKLAGEALLDHVIGTEEPEYTTPYDINIIGEYNLSGELWQVKPLLDELGIRILACISGDAQISRSRQFAPRPRRDDGLLQGDDQRRAQDGRALRHPVLRRLVLRHRRHRAIRCARSRGCWSSAARRTS